MPSLGDPKGTVALQGIKPLYFSFQTRHLKGDDLHG
jgi:hypothetical protein